MTRSQIFAEAHSRTFKGVGNYRQLFALNLMEVYQEIRDKQPKAEVKKSVNEVKDFLLRRAFETMKTGFGYGFNQQLTNDALDIISRVSHMVGFASDVAKTALKYNRLSEKQAYVIASAYTSI